MRWHSKIPVFGRDTFLRDGFIVTQHLTNSFWFREFGVE
jgi:hypothetical protein